MLECSIQKKIGPLQVKCEFKVDNNELLVILGASGCGKSTLLNLIAGMKTPDDGYIRLNNVLIHDNGVELAPIQSRRIGYIQQESCLFPHMTVKENMMYSIPKNRQKYEETNYQALVNLLGLQTHENEYPRTLSGGQSQRVAIGRALMMNPELILWDEPFSALDHMIRDDMRILVKQVKDQLNVPMIFVTHDLDEAFQLSDTLAVMKDGQVLQMGSRDRLFESPQSSEIARMLGVSNILNGKICATEKDLTKLSIDSVKMNCKLDHQKLINNTPSVKTGKAINIGIRPEHIRYIKNEEVGSDEVQSEENNIYKALILDIQKHLDKYSIKLKIKGLTPTINMTIPSGASAKHGFELGDEIHVLIKASQVLILAESN